MSRKEFEDISIPKRKIALKSAGNSVYRVYRNPTEFDLVVAENASEAVIKSGIKQVFMLKYGENDDIAVFNSDMLVSESL